MRINAPACTCPVGYIDDYPNFIPCQICTPPCKTCQDTVTFCLTCIGILDFPQSRIINDCHCPDAWYDDYPNFIDC